MTFLPIVARELRVASRRPQTYWVRAAAAGACLLVALWSFVISRHSDPAELGLAFFTLLSGTACLYCLFSGVRWTSDCLSQEKRDGTLGLLFLTDLRGYDVVFGKLAANSLAAVYGVLATLPILALPLLLGGVTLGDVGRVSIVALNTLFLSLAIGIAVSASVRNSRQSAGIVIGLLLLFSAVLPVLGAWLESQQKIRAMHPFFYCPSPGFAYFWAFDLNYRRGPSFFWGSVVTIHLLAWLALMIASFVAPRSWQDRPPGSLMRALGTMLRRLAYGRFGQNREYRRRLLEKNPVFWLLARSPGKVIFVWILFAFGLALWCWGWIEQGDDWLTEPVYVLTAIILNVVLKTWVAAETGRQFAEDRQQGGLELLLCTPIELKEIFRGQYLALRRQFLAPILLVVSLFFLFLLLTLKESYPESSTHDFWILFWLAGMTMLVVDCYAIYWVGMWQGMTARSPNRVAAETSSRILVLPWLGIAFFLLLLALSSWSAGVNPTGFIVLWVVIGLLVDVVLGVMAFDNLNKRFREVAARKYLPQQSFWSRVFRP